MTDRTSTTAYSLELEDPIPDFDDMPGADGGSYGLSSFDDKPVLVFAFISNGCPMVRAYDGARLISIQKVYGPRGVQVVAINSNNAHLSPIDGYEEVVERAEEAGYNFPYLKDEDGRVARVLEATTTPHVFVFDRERRLRYRGRIDNSRDPSKATRPYLELALTDVLEGRPVEAAETQPFGCAIVW